MEGPGYQPPCSVEGTGVGVAPSTPTSRPFWTKTRQSDCLVHKRDAIKKGYRGGVLDKVAIQSFRSSQKGAGGEPNHSRFIQTKQDDSLPQVQDAFPERSAQEPTKGLLHLQYRSEGRLLARTSYPEAEAVLGLQVRGEDVSLSRHALRTECGPSRLHEGSVRSNEAGSQGRGLGPPLPRRHPHHLGFRHPEREGRGSYPGHHGTARFYDKRKEVQANAGPTLSMAGDRLEPKPQQIMCNTKRNLGEIQGISAGDLSTGAKEETNHECSGSGELDGEHRPNPQDDNGSDEEDIEGVSAPETQARKDSSNPIHASQTPSLERLPANSVPSRRSGAAVHHYDGRLQQGLGNCHRREAIPGDLPSLHGVLHKRQGAISSLAGAALGGASGGVNQNLSRQYPGYIYGAKRVRQDISPAFSGGANLEETARQKTGIGSEAYQRVVQRPLGSVIAKHSYFNGMGSPGQGVQERHSSEVPQSGVGPVCDFTQSQAPQICSALPRPRRISGRRADTELVCATRNIYVPTDSVGVESGGEVAGLETTVCSPRDGVLASQTLVRQTVTSQQLTFQDFGSTSTDSRTQDGDAAVTYRSSRVEFMRTALGKTFPGEKEIIDLLVSTVRPSSSRDYQTKFKLFMNFLKARAVPLEDTKLLHVLQFFMSLFRSSRSARTIYSYRSALAKPLKWYFDINLSSQYVSDLLKAMVLQRPNQPPREITWDVKDLLSFLEETSHQQDESTTLPVMAVLLLLATGWRISELHACVRDSEFLSIDTHQVLKIRPHKAFLAKNEDPGDRWGHVSIKPLYLQDGRRSSLCPVLNLQHYLKLTDRVRKGPLFIRPGTEDPMTLATLRRLICNLISRACPGASPGAHDLRKVAASLALVDCMDLSFVTSTMNWSSSTTFIKHYLLQTSPLDVPLATPGRR